MVVFYMQVWPDFYQQVMEEDAGIGMEEPEAGAEMEGDTDNDDADDQDTEVTVSTGSRAKQADPDTQMAHTYGITPEQLKSEALFIGITSL